MRDGIGVRSGIVTVVAVGALLVGCAGGPKPRPRSGSAAGGASAGSASAGSATGKTARPSALKRVSPLERVLRRAALVGRAKLVIAYGSLEPLLRTLRDARATLGAAPGGARLIAKLERGLRGPLAGKPLTTSTVRDMLARYGIDPAGAAAFITGGRNPLQLFTFSDPGAFRRAFARLLPFGNWQPRDRDGRTLWRFISRTGSRVMFQCHFRRGKLSPCARDLAPYAAVVAASGNRARVPSSAWSRLSRSERARVLGRRAPHVVIMSKSAVLHATALVRLARDSVTIDVDALGRVLKRPTALIPGGAAGPLHALYRALGSNERLYARIGQVALSRAFQSGPLAGGQLSGEVLLLRDQRCALPALIAGTRRSTDVKAWLRGIAKLVTRGKLKAQVRKAGAQLAVMLSGARRALGSSVPDRIGLAATPRGLLLSSWRCLASYLALLHRTTPKPGAESPFLAGSLALGDPLGMAAPVLRHALGGPGPAKLMRKIALVRFLASQLERGTIELTKLAPGRLRASLALQLRHRGPSDDKARALWHRAVTARNNGKLTEYKRLAARVTAEHGGTRFAAAIKRAPTLLAALGGTLAAIAIPAMVRYVRKSKAVEATDSLDRIKAGAKSYFQADHYSKRGVLLAKRFPAHTLKAPIDTGWTPKVPCCKQPGRKCAAGGTAWNTPVWRGLSFWTHTNHYFQYRFRTSGKNRRAKYVVEARADLDCDGKYSSYKILGSVDREFGIVTKGPIIKDELE